jgi:hypothetical protein
MSRFVFFDHDVEDKYFEPDSVNEIKFDPAFFCETAEPLVNKGAELLLEDYEAMFNALVSYAANAIGNEQTPESHKKIGALAVRLYCVLFALIRSYKTTSCILRSIYIKDVMIAGSQSDVTYIDNYYDYRFVEKNLAENIYKLCKGHVYRILH